MNIKVNSMRSAAVNQEIFWIPIDEVEPPAGVKLLLINERNGVAVLGTYHQKHQWTHWQGLPKFKQPGDKMPQQGEQMQEPVGCIAGTYCDYPLVRLNDPTRVLPFGTALYIQPQPSRPLTNEQVKAGLIDSIDFADQRERCAFNIGVRFAERAHRIGV